MTRENRPPSLSWVYPLGDDQSGVRMVSCPGAATCSLDGTPTVFLDAPNPDGDAVTIDVEVVEHGAAFTGTPTFTQRLPRGAIGENLRIPLPGLTPEKTYDFAVRASDELGAVAPGADFLGGAFVSHDGWVRADNWSFEKGPCAHSHCACVPSAPVSSVPGSSASQCFSNSDCCSGNCVLSSVPGICR